MIYPFKTISRMFAIALVVISTASCRNRSLFLHADYLKPLPEDTELAIKLNIGALYDETNLAENRDFKSIKYDFLDKIETRSLRNNLKEIFNDFSESGLNLDRPVVIAGPMDSRKHGCVLIAAVKDIKKLQELCSQIENETDSAFEYEQCGDYWFGEFENSCFAFNKKSLVFGSERDRDRIEDLISQKKIPCKNKPGFKGFLKDKSELSIWVEMEPVVQSLPKEQRKMLDGKSLDDSSVLLSVSTKKDITMKMYLDGFKEFKKDIAKSKSGGDKSLYEYLPGDCFAAFNFRVKNLEETYDNLNKDLRKELNGWLKELGCSVSDFTGNFAAAVRKFDIDYMQDRSPEFVIAFGGTHDLFSALEEKFGDNDNLAFLYDQEVISVVFCSDSTYPTHGKFKNDFTYSPLSKILKNGGFGIDFSQFDYIGMNHSFYKYIPDNEVVDMYDQLVENEFFDKLGLMYCIPHLSCFELTITSADQKPLVEHISKAVLNLTSKD